METGTIFNIQHFSLHDGPGIRTTIFLKGCPLNCLWCHNPESKAVFCELSFSPKLCIGCGACAQACSCHQFTKQEHSILRKNCTACGNCANICPSKALEMIGKTVTVDEVINEALRDSVFYETSQGGITISGGEPLLQFSFTLALLKKAKENGLHTCIETCGFSDFEKLQQLAAYTDLFLYDYKETDPQRHKAYTGVENHLIVQNLERLNHIGAAIILRCPIIPGYNDREEHFNGIAALANALSQVIEINLEPYHPLGQSKAEQIGKEYGVGNIDFPSKESMQAWAKAVQAKTNKAVKVM